MQKKSAGPRDDFVLDEECQCRRLRNLTVHETSTCGLLSTNRGPEQKVISFSFYLGNPKDPKVSIFPTKSQGPSINDVTHFENFLHKFLDTLSHLRPTSFMDDPLENIICDMKFMLVFIVITKFELFVLWFRF
jgi:hypothetical protein